MPLRICLLEHFIDRIGCPTVAGKFPDIHECIFPQVSERGSVSADYSESEMFSEDINESQLAFELCLIPFQLKLRILPKEDMGLNSDLKFFWYSAPGDRSIEGLQLPFSSVKGVLLI